MDSMDNMDTTQFDPIDPASTPAPARRWSGRTRRVVTSVAVGAVLLGSGAGIGVALTGGASASTGGPSSPSGNPTSTSLAAGNTSAGGSASTTASSVAAARCAKLEQRLRANDHPKAANLVQVFCRSPLLRLRLVGGEHGEVTFQSKAGPKTIAIERGTIQAVTSSNMTVVAKDGTTWTWDFTTSTKVRDAGHAVPSTNLSTGELVFVGGPVVSGVYDAQMVQIRPASSPASSPSSPASS
ncbi:MAG TPA: hypothetical protein VK802_21110 [Streptosporangiaceae bacterium]|jgi:hypothetical protein|nr:hypothetical protein [Streptosporangiaceae bacterium]